MKTKRYRNVVYIFISSRYITIFPMNNRGSYLTNNINVKAHAPAN